jgi:hypothetical protein
VAEQDAFTPQASASPNLQTDILQEYPVRKQRY